MREDDNNLFQSDEFDEPKPVSQNAPRMRPLPSKVPLSMQDCGVFGRLRPGNVDATNVIDRSKEWEIDSRGKEIMEDEGRGVSPSPQSILGGPCFHSQAQRWQPNERDEFGDSLEFGDGVSNGTGMTPRSAVPIEAVSKGQQPKWGNAGDGADTDSGSDGEDENHTFRAVDTSGLAPSGGVSFLHKGSAFSYSGERIRRPQNLPTELPGQNLPFSPNHPSNAPTTDQPLTILRSPPAPGQAQYLGDLI